MLGPLTKPSSQTMSHSIIPMQTAISTHTSGILQRLRWLHLYWISKRMLTFYRPIPVILLLILSIILIQVQAFRQMCTLRIQFLQIQHMYPRARHIPQSLVIPIPGISQMLVLAIIQLNWRSGLMLALQIRSCLIIMWLWTIQMRMITTIHR